MGALLSASSWIGKYNSSRVLPMLYILAGKSASAMSSLPIEAVDLLIFIILGETRWNHGFVRFCEWYKPSDAIV